MGTSGTYDGENHYRLHLSDHLTTDAHDAININAPQK
jgi:hypothetical protein